MVSAGFRYEQRFLKFLAAWADRVNADSADLIFGYEIFQNYVLYKEIEEKRFSKKKHLGMKKRFVAKNKKSKTFEEEKFYS